MEMRPPLKLTPEQAAEVGELIDRVDLYLHGDAHLRLAGAAGWKLDALFQDVQKQPTPRPEMARAREELLAEIFALRHELIMLEGFEMNCGE